MPRAGAVPDVAGAEMEAVGTTSYHWGLTGVSLISDSP